MLQLIAAALLVGALIIAVVFLRAKDSKPAPAAAASTSSVAAKPKAPAPVAPLPVAAASPAPSNDNVTPLGVLKGHTGAVSALAFSRHALASAASDRAILLWPGSHLLLNDHRTRRIALEGEEGTALAFANDGKILVTALGAARAIAVHSVFDEKQADGKYFRLQSQFNTGHSLIKGMAVGGSPAFIVTCSTDTDVRVWDLAGNKLHALDSKTMNNAGLAMSGDGRFFALASWSSEVKIFEILRKKDGSFDKVAHLGSLVGHKQSVYAVAFAPNNTNVVTLSKDGSMKLWNLDVRYHAGEDFKIVSSIDVSTAGTLPESALGISPDSKFLAVSCGSLLQLRRYPSLQHLTNFNAEHAGTILSFSWNPSDSSMLATCGEGAREVRLWKVTA
jgi:WD40 repeat protein